MPALRRLVVALAALALAAAALAACSADGPFQAKASGLQSFDAAVAAVGPDLKVRVEMFNGPIDVRAGKAGTIHAEVRTTGVGSSPSDAEADRQKIQVTLTVNPDGTALLRASYQPDPNAPGSRSAGAVVDVPPGAALDLRTSNGHVSTGGVSGPIDARTTNGPVTLAGLGSGATVRTTNGAVEVDGAGLLDLETTNGGVTIRGTGATVDVRTSNGDVSFDGTFSDGSQQIATTNAPITLRLPAGAGFALDASTTNAKVTLDGFTIRTTGATSGSTMQGVVGTGGPRVVLRSSNAAIVVSAQ